MKQNTPGLYVHIPFCRSKCPYCGFCSTPGTSLILPWLNALEKEIDLYRNDPQWKDFGTLYLGGGTPSWLPSQVLERTVDRLFSRFSFQKNAEFTVEANPCDMTKEKVSVLKASGVNRVNLGVQSFDDAVLRTLGRRHTSHQAWGALELLRSSGFENIGIDLMYGVPGQPMGQWLKTLARAVSFGPEHMSCYQLTFEPRTPFQRLKRKGVLVAPNEEDERAFFLATADFLEDQGYVHYEISNFARGEERASRHNLGYWRHVPYLGLGPSAHSFDGSQRWWNLGSVRAYCRELHAGRTAEESRERLTPDQVRGESIMLGARTAEGFDLNEVFSSRESGVALSRLVEAGFLQVRQGRAIPTRKGFLVADRLAVDLIPESCINNREG